MSVRLMAPHGHALSATFHLTHNCNLRCVYCYTGDKLGAGMSTETAGRAVDFALSEARRSKSTLLEVVFFGGEPLLKRDLLVGIMDQVIAQRGGLETSFKMSTNGLLLDDELLAELIRRRVFISVSIDGRPETQDTQRIDARGMGTSGRIERIIPKLLEANPCTNVTCVITPSSACRLDESVEWLYDAGFRYISTALDHGAVWTESSLTDLDAAYRRLSRWYVGKMSAGRKLYLSCFDERIRSWTRGSPSAMERCLLGVRQFSIAPSGSSTRAFSSCGDDDPTFVLGDVFSGFDDRKREQLLSCVEAEKDECAGCVLKPRCSSWCACVNWQSTGRIDRASPLVCAHERSLIPVADGIANELWDKRNRRFIDKFYDSAFPVLGFLEDMIVRDS
ncbi:MAG: radical SAM protein [Deltaproteobacteria bacterium]|nr:radical SAM protein [Deltaproteobacteria bacterium]